MNELTDNQIIDLIEDASALHRMIHDIREKFPPPQDLNHFDFLPESEQYRIIGQGEVMNEIETHIKKMKPVTKEK